MVRGSRTAIAALALSVAAVTALGSTPALAKGDHAGPGHAWRCPIGGDPYCPAGRVVIQGPGLEHGVTIQGRAFWTMWYLSGLDTRPFGAEEPSPPPAGHLGPGYQATYLVKVPHGRTLSLGQDLYPYATGMVWTHTASGQRFYDDWHAYTAPGGWWHSVALRELLLGHWLPAVSPVGAVAASGSSALRAVGRGGNGGGDGPRGPAGAVAIAVATLALLLLAAAVLGRPRRVASEVSR